MRAVSGELPVAPSTVTMAVDKAAHVLKFPSIDCGSADQAQSVPAYGGNALTAEITCGEPRSTPQAGAAAAGAVLLVARMNALAPIKKK